MAGEEEVRLEAVVGRPDRAHRQRRPGVDGLRDLRLRRRARGRLGARRGRLLGPRADLARGRALHRRPRARVAAGRRPDGPDLREPRGPERHARPARLGARHPRDVPPDGDERRGDRRPDRRRPHLRQDPRCGRPRGARRPRAGGCAARAPGPGLEELLRHRRGQGRDHQWPRGHLDRDPDPVGQRLLRQPLRLRVGAVVEPRGCPSVGGEGRRRSRHDPGARRGRRVASADDAHHRPGAADGPGVRRDLEALPREPGRVRRRVRAAPGSS